jgi:hypothetical protein
MLELLSQISHVLFGVLPGLFIVSLLFAAVNGLTDALYYSRKGAHALPWNEHIILVVSRAIFILGMLAGILTPSTNMFWVFVQFASFILAFSFVHNGAYYLFRDKIDGTNFGFKHKSPTSTAKLDFTYKQRTMQLIMGLILLIGYMLIR